MRRRADGSLKGVTTTDYLISAVLILLVIPQIRGTRVTLRTAMLPVVCVAAAAAYYLKSFPTAGHDVRLYVVGAVVGAVLGLACGAATLMSRGSDGVAFAKAGVAAAALWIAGMLLRSGFEFWSAHSGAEHIARFSRDHMITSSDAWTVALLLMAFAQVLARLIVIRTRARRVTASAATASALAEG